MYEIPLLVPSLKGNELKYLEECIETEWISSAGSFVELFEKKVAQYTGAKYAIACVNGTSALQVSLRVAGVETGDEVIVPTLTFISTINSIAYNGASPIFMDVDEYYNLDCEKVIDFISKNTFFKGGFTYNKTTKKKISAIIPVHVWGNPVYMDKIISFAKDRNISIVEDAAESLGSFYKDGKYAHKHTGTIGDFGCLSFNGNKIITTGGGGMILTDNFEKAKKVKYLTTQAKDDAIRYVHNEIGYNYRITNLQAAIGVAQIEQLKTILVQKKRIFSQYEKLFDNLIGVELTKRPIYAENNNWLNVIKISGSQSNYSINTIMKKLDKAKIESRPVWLLNHEQTPYKLCQTYRISNALALYKHSLCLPSSINLKNSDIVKVVEEIELSNAVFN